MHISFANASIITISALRNSLIIFCIIIVLALVIYLIYDYLRVPFWYPRVTNYIDLSGRRLPSYDDCIDEWLISYDGHSQAIIDLSKETTYSW